MRHHSAAYTGKKNGKTSREMEQGSFDTPTGWLTFLHRAYQLRLYRYELMLDDGSTGYLEREKKTTYFGAINDLRIYGDWTHPGVYERWKNGGSFDGPKPPSHRINGINLYDAETGELVDWKSDTQWVQWETAKANRKEVERRNDRKLYLLQAIFMAASAVFMWAVGMAFGSYAGTAAGL